MGGETYLVRVWQLYGGRVRENRRIGMRTSYDTGNYSFWPQEPGSQVINCLLWQCSKTGKFGTYGSYSRVQLVFETIIIHVSFFYLLFFAARWPLLTSPVLTSLCNHCSQFTWWSSGLLTDQPQAVSGLLQTVAHSAPEYVSHLVYCLSPPLFIHTTSHVSCFRGWQAMTIYFSINKW